MARSFRKTPIHGICGGSEKRDKRCNNRRLRHKVKQKLITCGTVNDLVLPIMKEVSDPWGMTKDGKFYFGECNIGENVVLFRK